MESLICGSWTAQPQPQNINWDNPSDEVLAWAMGGLRSDAGTIVNANVALSHTPIWHGLMLLGGDAGSLVMQLKRIQGEELVDDKRHVAYQLTSVKPHSLICPSTFYELVLTWAILHGNAVFRINRTNGGRPLPVPQGGGFEPLIPQTTAPEYDDNGKLWIATRRLIDGFQLGEKILIDPDDTWHIKNLTSDGFWGKGIIEVGKNRIANGVGYLQHSNYFFQNSAKPDFLFTFPGRVPQEDLNKFRERMAERRGLAKRGDSLIIDQGMTAVQLGMTLEDAQYEELVKLDNVQCASLLGIPAIMLNAMDRATFNNTEESERWYINRTLRRWLNKIAEESLRKLMTDLEQRRYEFQWDMSPLLKGRLAERYAAYSQARSAGWLNGDEVRAMEGLNPVGLVDYANPAITPGDRGDEEDTEEPPDRTEDAQELRALMHKEDNALELRSTGKDFCGWMEGFYDGRFQIELSVHSKSAKEYCDQRKAWWLSVAGAVNSKESLRDLIKAQSAMVGGRVSELLTGDLVCASESN